MSTGLERQGGGRDMDISIITINYNSSAHTVNCIRSVFDSIAAHKLKIEMIVVDNNSESSDFVYLKRSISALNHNNLILVESHKNTGFAYGNMLGANQATGKYLFFLNNDCMFRTDVLQQLFEFMEQNPAAGVVPRFIGEDGKYSSSFGYMPSVINQWLGYSLCRLFNRAAYPEKKAWHGKPLEVSVISGAAMFLRRSDFNEIGGFDTNYFLYCEEEDICIRFRNGLKTVWCLPDAEISHAGGGSTNRSLLIEKEFYISLFYFLSKNYGWLDASLIKFRYVIKELLRYVRNSKRWPVALFLLSGPHLGRSLRHIQQCRDRS
ncbi:glycosyltransferase family 2 protein [Pseudaeromonas pectinilytica]